MEKVYEDCLPPRLKSKLNPNNRFRIVPFLDNSSSVNTSPFLESWDGRGEDGRGGDGRGEDGRGESFRSFSIDAPDVFSSDRDGESVLEGEEDGGLGKDIKLGRMDFSS